eukprot:TRINITY_DN1448_c0_g1_i4.p1 TRINITY_DN1448_c0_g1~~TRINITY_DN1448_c0_g1_i4.p1  ORF type:complete len:241 (-),score=46.19 TRINITY_DN1448_c0_g1_i4:96-818(-)
MTTHTHTTHNTHQQHKLTHNTQTTQQALNVGNGNELFWKQLTRIVCFGGAPTDNVGKDGIAQVEQAMGDNTWFHMFKEHTARLIFIDKRPRLRVLVVDDNLVNCKLVSRMFSRLGCSYPDCKQNGKEALLALLGISQQQQQEEQQWPATATTCCYDIVLLDMYMPVMDGWECMQHICRIYPPRVRPFVVAMHGDTRLSSKRFKAAGMVGALQKPVRMSALWNMLVQLAFAGPNPPHLFVQ